MSIDVNTVIAGSSDHLSDTEAPALAVEWKNDLRGLMARLGDALKQAQSAEAAFSEFNSNVGFGLRPHKVIIEELGCWVTSRIDYINDLANNVTHARITRSQLSNTVNDFDYPRVMVAPDCSVDHLLSYVVNSFPVEQLLSDLLKQSEVLEARGLRDAAEYLGDRFCLFDIPRYRGPKHLNVKGVRGKFMLTYRHYGRHYERAQSTDRMTTMANTFERFTGVTGLAFCLSSIRNAELRLGWNESIPSRMRFCVGEEIEAIYFNEEIKLYLTQDIFHALLSFIKTNTDKALMPLVSE